MSQDRFKKPQNEQSSSFFFSILPGEVRNKIYGYTFAQYEDMTDPYPQDAVYRRPGYEAPLRISCSLLRSCQRVYNEACLIPIKQAEHLFYVGEPYRAPPEFSNLSSRVRKMSAALEMLTGTSGSEFDLAHARIFMQTGLPHDEETFQPLLHLLSVLEIKHFHPLLITITIRHTDWDRWEQDSPLDLDSAFVDRCRLPNSVRELRMELETVERKKDQLEYVVKETAKWCFITENRTVLLASEKDSRTTTWNGTSIMHGTRWTRDESDDTPEIIAFHTETVVWKRDTEPMLSIRPPPLSISVPAHLKSQATPPGAVDSLSLEELHDAGVDPGTPASIALDLVAQYHDRSLQRIMSFMEQPSFEFFIENFNRML